MSEGRPARAIVHRGRGICADRLAMLVAPCGVDRICRVLEVAQLGYHTHRRRLKQPARRATRAHRDEMLRVELRRVWQTNRRVCGVRKVRQ